jgi:uncharacterized lipoprotein YmbA
MTSKRQQVFVELLLLDQQLWHACLNDQVHCKLLRDLIPSNVTQLCFESAAGESATEVHCSVYVSALVA